MRKENENLEERFKEAFYRSMVKMEDNPNVKAQNQISINLIHDALEAEDGIVLCIHGRSKGAGGVLKTCSTEDYHEFAKHLIERAICEENYAMVLRRIHGMLSDLLHAVDHIEECNKKSDASQSNPNQK